MISPMITPVFSLSPPSFSLSPLSTSLRCHKQTIVLLSISGSGVLPLETSRVLWEERNPGTGASEKKYRERNQLEEKERRKRGAFCFEGNVVWLEVHAETFDQVNLICRSILISDQASFPSSKAPIFVRRRSLRGSWIASIW
uniref:Uncharacterized protein n=1 Tax=Oryza brachyantha TaxID=4533 RepID=J3LFB1_ORYBR